MVHAMPLRRVSYGAKVITAGVALKAALMGTLVSVLAVAPFVESLVLVLVSAAATGVFAVLVVLIQVHSERNLHERLDWLEGAADRLEQKADEVKATTETVAEAVTPDRRTLPDRRQ